MKIDRYQGWVNKNGNGAINDHQINECVLQFFNIPEEKAEIILAECLDILNNGIDCSSEMDKETEALMYQNMWKNAVKELNYLKLLISDSIENQKDEVGAKALRQVIREYNEWMLCHTEYYGGFDDEGKI